MAFNPQNFVDGQGPVMRAVWLNGLDVTANFVLNGAQTVAAAQLALGIPTGTSPLSIGQGGTGQINAANALAALGGTTLAAASAAALAAISRNFIGLTLFPLVASEIALGYTSSTADLFWPYGDVRRLRADPTGVVDSTTAINNALQLYTLVYAPGGTYTISGTLVMRTGQTFYGDGAATLLQYANSSINNINMASCTGSTVRSMKVAVTGTTAGTKTAAVYLKLSTACHVHNLEMTGMTWSGIWIDTSNSCDIHHNYFHDFTTLNGADTIIDQADITIYNQQSSTQTSQYNNIHHNQCMSHAEHGIAIEDPYFATTIAGFPSHNTVSNNKIGAGHTGYGCLLYMPGSLGSPPGACDTYNQFNDNDVSGVTGNVVGVGANPASGTGLYMVGSGIGATEFKGNTVFNCCILTGLRQLAPGGIGVNGVATGLTRPLISGNIISGMTQGDGICVTSSPGGVLVAGNSINMPSSNNGGGAGGPSLQGAGIRSDACSDVDLESNNVLAYGNGPGIYVHANGVNSSNVVITGGSVTVNGTGPALQTGQTGGFNLTQFSCTGTRFRSLNATPDCLSLNAIIVGQFANVVASAVTARALFLNGCTSVRFASGELTTTGAVAVGTSGTCTNSFISKAVNIGITTGGTGSLVSNAGTGCNIEQNFTGVPSAGTWLIGDRAVAIGAAVASGNAKAWSRVTTGAGNVLATDWISEGNL